MSARTCAFCTARPCHRGADACARCIRELEDGRRRVSEVGQRRGRCAFCGARTVQGGPDACPRCLVELRRERSAPARRGPPPAPAPAPAPPSRLGPAAAGRDPEDLRAEGLRMLARERARVAAQRRRAR